MTNKLPYFFAFECLLLEKKKKRYLEKNNSHSKETG